MANSPFDDQDQFIPWEDPRSDYGRPANVPDNQGLNVADLYQGFKGQITAQDALNRLIANFPVRQPPGKMANILAAIASMGAGAHPSTYSHGSALGFQAGTPQEIMQAGDLIRYRPFYQQLQDWQAQLQPVEAAANQERYYNQNMRQLLGQETARFLTEKHYQDQASHWTQQEALTRDANARKWWEATLKYNQLERGDWDYRPDRQGVMRAYDKHNPDDSGKVIIDPETLQPATGIQLPFKEQEEIRTLGRIRTIEAQGRVQEETIRARAQYDPRKPIINVKDPTTGEMLNLQQDPGTGVFYQIQMGTGAPPVPSVKPTISPTAPTGTGIPNDRPSTDFLTKGNLPPEVVPPRNLESSLGKPTPVESKELAGLSPDEIIAKVLGPEPQTQAQTQVQATKPITGQVTKLGQRDPNAPTAAMRDRMDFAQRQLHGIERLQDYADQLDKLGKFGIVQSRVNEWSKKLGTAVDLDNLANIASGVGSDMISEGANYQKSSVPLDRLLGQFFSELGFVVSGASRAHTSRMGIETINYLKTLLNPKATKAMFDGNLKVFRDRMTEYATPLAPLATPKQNESLKDDLDKKIDAALAGARKKGGQ